MIECSCFHTCNCDTAYILSCLTSFWLIRKNQSGREVVYEYRTNDLKLICHLKLREGEALDMRRASQLRDQVLKLGSLTKPWLNHQQIKTRNASLPPPAHAPQIPQTRYAFSTPRTLEAATSISGLSHEKATGMHCWRAHLTSPHNRQHKSVSAYPRGESLISLTGLWQKVGTDQASQETFHGVALVALLKMD